MYRCSIDAAVAAAPVQLGQRLQLHKSKGNGVVEDLGRSCAILAWRGRSCGTHAAPDRAHGGGGEGADHGEPPIQKYGEHAADQGQREGRGGGAEEGRPTTDSRRLPTRK